MIDVGAFPDTANSKYEFELFTVILWYREAVNCQIKSYIDFSKFNVVVMYELEVSNSLIIFRIN